MERKRKSAETKISEIEARKLQYQSKIDNYKSKIAGLEANIQELSEVKKQKELENLLKVIKSAGKTPEDVISALKKEEDL